MLESDIVRRITGFCGVCLCILFVITSIPEAESALPQMATKQMNISFEMGKDAQMTCTIHDIGKRKVIWKRLSDPFPISVGTTMFAPRSKYRVKQLGDNWRLTIKNIRISDAGEYECRLSGAEGMADVLSLIIPGAGETYITPTDTTVLARPGDDVVLPCHVQKIRKSLVLWQNEDRHVVSLRKKVYSGDTQRVRVQHGSREEWSLRINGVKDADYGVYTCVVNTDPPLTRSVTLRRAGADTGFDKKPETGESVSKSPTLVLDTFRKQVDVHEGHTVTLTCKFYGEPTPRIRWSRRIMKDGEKVTEDLNVEGENYLLTDAKPGDTGVYVCSGTNGVPPLGSGKIRVNVTEITTTTPTTTTTFDPTEASKPRAYTVQDAVYQRRGSDAVLTCKGIGVPRPEITWSYNGQLIQNDWKHSILNEEDRHHTANSALTVRSLSSHNYGKYECYVWNRHGDDKIIVTLILPA